MPWCYIFFSRVPGIWGPMCAGVHCMARPHMLLSLEPQSPRDSAWPGPSPVVPWGLTMCPCLVGGETAPRLQAEGSFYPVGRTSVLGHCASSLCLEIRNCGSLYSWHPQTGMGVRFYRLC